MSNQLHEFLLPELGVRGAVVEFDHGIDAMLGSRPYPAAVRTLLGQALAAMPLMAANTKFEGRMSLQFRGHNALSMLVAQIEAGLQVRAMAKAEDDAEGDFQALMHGGQLGLLLEPANSDRNYQALVPIEGHSLATALEGYYERSEQIPSKLVLAAGDGVIRGIVIQRLPLGEKASSVENWEHVCALFATLGEAELLAVDALTVLRRLFHEETVRVFEPRPVALTCRCSRQSISIMMLSLGEAELQDHLASHPNVDVTCEFCGQRYLFTRDDVDELFLRVRTQPESPTRH